MLSEDPPTRFHAACDRCGAVHNFEARDVDTARLSLRTLGWREAPVLQRMRDRWLWWCSRCAPHTPSQTMQ